MKIELINNKKVILNNGKSKKEIHPFWLRERVGESDHLDPGTQQRLFDPATLNFHVDIDEANLEGNYLNIKFNDGIVSKFEINKLSTEFLGIDNELDEIEKIQWDCSLKNIKSFEYYDDFFESKDMYNMLVSFYKYGFVIIKNIPTENNFLIKFGNSIGSVKRTNFGEHFDVKSKSNPNDLAYTSLHLTPHTDNPYRNPLPPCIQILHCIENEVNGGYSTLVDGYTVSEYIKKNKPDYYDILSSVKVRFKFVDKDVVLESWSELIHLDKNKKFKSVRFSTRLDYVPILEKKELELYYEARKYLSDLYNSDKYRIEFKLMPGDLMMMDNHRLLHGRTAFNPSEGNRFLQGCYLDFDSTEGKLRYLKRKFKF
tara:strand:- start:344 stop:1453 length:1110 start_codon:yes stop_codon:yes gene_type:complete